MRLQSKFVIPGAVPVITLNQLIGVFAEAIKLNEPYRAAADRIADRALASVPCWLTSRPPMTTLRRSGERVGSNEWTGTPEPCYDSGSMAPGAGAARLD